MEWANWGLGAAALYWIGKYILIPLRNAHVKFLERMTGTADSNSKTLESISAILSAQQLALGQIKALVLRKRSSRRGDPESQSILVVDDHEGIRVMLTHCFEKRGHLVRTATDGTEALKLLEEGFEPNVIVLDILMEPMDGNEFLDRMIKRGYTADIVVLSAVTDELREEYRQLVKIVPKPPDCRKLCELVEN